jgi:succinate-semialdehyde dehydrogenase / glutarate-semialdehyde dehydrogenase
MVEESMALPSGVPTGMLVAGSWVGGSAGAFPVLDPTTGAVLCEVPRAGLDDLDTALNAAGSAQAGWAACSPRARAEVLRRAFDIMNSRQKGLTQLICAEAGKTEADAAAEIAYAAEFFRWFGEEACRVGGELRNAPSGANWIMTIRKPVGVALLLTPWNFPAAMVTRKVAPALAAGCAVVVKPAEDTPLTALAVAEVLMDAGVHPGVVNVLTTDQPAPLVGAALSDARVRKLSFTGSTSVGRLLLRLAADRVVNCSMELGGNDPFVVLDDADLDAAVDGAMVAKMRNGGQACTAANRFLVHERIAEAFTVKLADRMASLRIGCRGGEVAEVGPMINARAVERLADQVQRSVAAGARLVAGGQPVKGPGFYFPPTVLADVPPQCAAATEELFGPIAPVITVRSDDEALAIANDDEMGLAGYVYSGDLARALRLAERLELGMVAINRGTLSDPAAPFGGVRQSGLGREGGREGIDAYLETEYISASWS